MRKHNLIYDCLAHFLAVSSCVLNGTEISFGSNEAYDTTRKAITIYGVKNSILVLHWLERKEILNTAV